MSSMDMLDLIGGIDSSYIAEADTARKRGKLISLRKWLPALAACTALILIIPAVWNIFRGKAGPDEPPEGLDESRLLDFNGCYYEVTDKPEVLAIYGLPEKITEDVAGEHISYLEPIGTVEYQQSAVQTDVEMFQYTGSPCRGAYIIKDQDHYYAAIFCNFTLMDNASVELGELYRVYDVQSADDIVSVTEVNWNRNKTVGKTITDRTAIADFYDITCSLVPNSNSEFQSKMFDMIPEEEQQEKHNSFANDLHVIRVETASGLRFYLEIFPSYEWMYGTGTLSYFQMSPELMNWVNSCM